MSSIRWEDLVFANRNQLYGAYILRKAYASRVTMGFGFAMAFFAAVLMSPMIKDLFKSEETSDSDITLNRIPIELQQVPPIQEIVIPKEYIKPPEVKAIKFVPPNVTNKDVDEDPPTIIELKNSVISTADIDGPVEFIDTPPAIADIKEETGDDINKIWIGPIEIPAEFPGGVQAMMKYFGSNTKYPSMARRLETEGTVFVQFVVDSDGSIDNVEVVKGIGANCDEEAMRVVSRMPEWKPGRQNGKSVKVRMVVPIKFSLGKA